MKSLSVTPYCLLLLLTLPTLSLSEQNPLVIESPESQTALIELFTSEGCSSCPPADRWLSGLKEDARLWKEFVPVAFHVDYWDYIGWKDRFADAKYSMRQRQYAFAGNASTVYTPGFFHNGKEWRQWFGKREIKTASNNRPGKLSAHIDNKNIEIVFEPTDKRQVPLMINVSVLGMNQVSEVRNGENGGKTLRHDFVALNWKTKQSSPDNSLYRWRFDRSVFTTDSINTQAIAFWITRIDDPTPLQAAGGWLR